MRFFSSSERECLFLAVEVANNRTFCPAVARRCDYPRLEGLRSCFWPCSLLIAEESRVMSTLRYLICSEESPVFVPNWPKRAILRTIPAPPGLPHVQPPPGLRTCSPPPGLRTSSPAARLFPRAACRAIVALAIVQSGCVNRAAPVSLLVQSSCAATMDVSNPGCVAGVPVLKEDAMDAKVYELINDQIRKELYSAYLCLSFADYYEEEGLEGFAHWYEIQTQEERDHALIFLQSICTRSGCKVKLQAIDQPDKTFSNHLEPLEAALEHEKYITSTINDINTAAFEAKDYRTMKFLDWFIEGAAGGRGQR